LKLSLNPPCCDGTGQASAPRIQETPEIEQIVRFFRGGDSTGQAGAPRIQETPKVEQIARSSAVTTAPSKPARAHPGNT